MGVEAYARSSQQHDFQEDAAAVGFIVVVVTWEDAQDTPSELKAVVRVAGCDVELRRADGEEAVRTDIVNTDKRRIERYTIENVVVGKVNVPLDKYRTGEQVPADTYIGGPWPMPADIRTYILSRGAQVFACADANA